MAGAAHATRVRARRGGPRRRHRVRWTVLWLLAAVVVFVASAAGGLFAAPVDFTPPAPPRPALIVDRNGVLIGEITSPEQRTEIPADQIPTVMRDAVVAAEDKRFYDSGGIDPIAIVRAALSDLRGNPTQGGSTITQQYVKNVFVGSAKSYVRKLKEASLAIRLEQRMSKPEILTRYLNVVFFGEGTYGVEAAAEYYFGVHAQDLTLSQASMLAGILPAPSAYNPVTNMTLARERQLYVLDRMVDSGYVTAATASDAYEHPPALASHDEDQGATSIAPEFVTGVAAYIKDKYHDQEDVLYRGGLRIQTTLDARWQQAAADALAKVLPSPDDPEAAVVVLDYQTGDVLAVANKTAPSAPHSDPARTAQRTSGSTVKPFTLATALENGDRLTTVKYGPSRKTYPVSACGTGPDGKPYTITNDEGGSGSYTLARALAKSVNTVYGPLAIELGTQKVAAVAKAAGLTDARGQVATNCAMGLGVTVSPFQEAIAYSTLADHGVRHGVRTVLSVHAGVGSTGAGGTTIYRAPPTATSVAMPAAVADQVVSAMRGVVAYGTATRARQPAGIDVFGKTGTTDDNTDAWFTGCVPAYSVCITTWMGYVTPTPMTRVEGVGPVQGGTLPAEIFAATTAGFRASPAP
ncbi:MAG TPA: transglycosylase domain-containing protein [Mycobacteriales bacterium]